MFCAKYQLVLVVVVIGISSVAEGFEQQFTLLNPEEGAVLAPGETYTVDRSGGNPDWNVNAQVIRILANAVIGAVALDIPNSGSASLTVPQL